MGEAKFTIVTDPERQSLRITFRGHWDIADVGHYKLALDAAVRSMRARGCPPGSICALVDMRAGGAQSQEVIAAWSDQLGTPTLTPRRLATLVSSALLKRQIGRIAIGNQRLFHEEDEALAWLQSGDDED